MLGLVNEDIFVFPLHSKGYCVLFSFNLFHLPEILSRAHSYADTEIILVTVTIEKYSCHHKYKSNKPIVK
jgi:hypothetical protein